MPRAENAALCFWYCLSYFKAKNKTECVIAQEMLRRELYTDTTQRMFV